MISSCVFAVLRVTSWIKKWSKCLSVTWGRHLTADPLAVMTQQPDNGPYDLHFLCRQMKRFHVAVGRSEFDGFPLLIEFLHRGLSSHQGYHGLPVFRMGLPGDDQDVSLADAFIDHGIAPNPQREIVPASQKTFRNLNRFRDFNGFNGGAGGNNPQEREGERPCAQGH